MLTPEWYEACTDQILVLYRQLEDDILKDIIRRMMKTGIVTESAKWQAEMLQESGLLYNDIMQKIAKYTSKTAEEVRLLFEEAGTEVMRNDNIIAQSATGHELRLSDSKLKILKANYRSTLGNLQNLTNTTAKTSQAAFIVACNNAHMQITSGAFSYQEAIRNAVRKFSDGVYVTYPSGHRDRLDVAIRRAALTGVGQTAAKISIMNAEEMDCDLMEITAHAGARPEHAKWQGKLVSRTGKNVGRIVDGVKVLSLTDIGYGTGAGFRGWNCRHDWYPYFEGYSTLNYTDEELARLDEKNIEYDGQMYSQYDISQMQRAKERKVRALKRECILNQTTAENAQDADLKSTMQTDYQKSAVKLKAAEQDLKAFCKATGQDRDRFREQVLGFGRSEAQRAVWANKKAQNTLTSSLDSGIIESDKVSSFRTFDSGDKVNDFFYYDDSNKKGVLQMRKGSYGKWYSGLSSDEKLCISSYCSADYDIVNSFLRKNNGFEYIDKDFAESMISGIDSAIAKFELRENVKTYRGANLESILKLYPDAENFSDLIGHIYHDKGYMSSSPLKSVAEKFATENGQDGILLEIDVPNGSGLGAYVNQLAGQFQDDEYEFLIRRNTSLEIYDVDESGIISILKCRWKK